MKERLPEQAGLKRVCESGENLRQRCHAQAQAALRAKDFQRLLLRLGAWMQEGCRRKSRR